MVICAGGALADSALAARSVIPEFVTFTTHSERGGVDHHFSLPWAGEENACAREEEKV